MTICVPVTVEGSIDPRWGRADRVAIARTSEGEITGWEEFDVGWGRLHDEGPEGAHHARVARFLMDHEVEAVVANHMGMGMVRMLERMGVRIHLGAMGDARQAAQAAAQSQAGE